jgi:hypothetical protein
MDDTRRIRREKRTITAMIGMYCRAHHEPGDGSLCEACGSLHEYALARIDRCPLCPDKPTCANCEIHCYRKDRREEVRQVMRWSGPRMMRRHPVLAVMHILDGRIPGRRTTRRPRSNPR